MADQTKVSFGVELDQASAAKTVKDADKLVKDLQRKLRGMGVDWSKVAKAASSVTGEINTIADAADTFARKLGTAATASLGKLKKLGDELEDAKEAASQLEEQYSKSEPGAARAHIEQAMAAQAKEIAALTQKIHAERGARTKELTQLTKLIKLQDKYQKTVQSAADFSMGDALGDAFGKLKGGDLKGMFKDLGGGLFKSAGSKYAQGAMSKAEAAGGMGTAEGAAGIANAAKMLSTAGLAIGAAAGAFVVFIELVKAASDHMTKLNKALIQGMGFANDMVGDAKGYRKVMDEFRQAAIDARESMLRFGKNSEDYLKVINAYAKESTGSLVKTAAAFDTISGGKFQDEANRFVESAIIYGKALNMEGEEVASMMGKMQSEMGYGAGQIQQVMNGVVQSAATANMPMTKFMEIFKSVIPDVELYRNRLEELTGTIKLLSKTMSPRDVKQFMDAFSKGFGGTDFKQRLKTVYIAGIENVNNTLEKGFRSRADTMADKFKQYVDPKEFAAAFKGGEQSMAAMMNKIAAKSGGQVSGTDIGEAMKLASYEAARQKGDPLDMATALRGASMGETYKILKDMSQRFGTGFDGMSEHVIAQLGISNDQYLALRQTHQSMQVWSDQIKKTGITSSKSLNEGIAKRMKALGMTMDDFKNLSGDDQERILFEASQEHEEAMGAAATMDDLAQEQVSATTSISEKISNVIAFLLEKLYNVMQPILDLLDDIWSWMTGNKEQQQAIKEITSWRDDSIKDYEKGAEAISKQASVTKDPKEKERLNKEAALQSAMAEQMRMFGDKASKSVGAGNTGEALVRSVISPKDVEKNFKDVAAMIIGSYGDDLSDVDKKRVESYGRGESMTNADTDRMIRLLGERNATANVMTLGRIKIANQGEAERRAARGEIVQDWERLDPEAAKKAGYRGATRRIGTDPFTGPKSKAEAERLRLAKNATDYEEEWAKRQIAATDAVAKSAGATPGAKVYKQRLQQATGAKPGEGATQQQMDQIKAVVANNPQAAAQLGLPADKPAEQANPQAAAQLGLPADKPAEQAKAVDKSATLLDSINVQVMGISGYLEDISKLLGEKGIVINKEKFRAQIVNGPIKDVLDKALADALLDYWLYSAKDEDIEKQLALAKKNELKDIGQMAEMARGVWARKYGLQDKTATGRGQKDFGGPIETTGYYRLMRGEEVVNPSLNGGSGSGKAVTINATINVSGAQNPEAVAAQVRKVLYDMSEKH